MHVQSIPLAGTIAVSGGGKRGVFVSLLSSVGSNFSAPQVLTSRL